MCVFNKKWGTCIRDDKEKYSSESKCKNNGFTDCYNQKVLWNKYKPFGTTADNVTISDINYSYLLNKKVIL